MALDIQPLDLQPLEDNKLDIQALDVQPLDEKESHNFLSPDLPLGIIENATTGGLNTLLGVGAKAAGGIYGALKSGSTAGEEGNKAAEAYANSGLAKALGARSESGKATEEMFGKAINSFLDYAKDAGPKELLGAIPFSGDKFANTPEIAAAVSAAGQALPDLSMLVPFLGHKASPVGERGPSIKERLEPGSQMNLPLDIQPLAETMKPMEAGAGPLPPEVRGDLSNRRQMGFDFDNQRGPIAVDKLGEAVTAETPANDLFARDQMTQRLQDQMDAQVAAEKAKERPNQTSLEDQNGQQSLFDQADQMGQRNQFNGGELGDWRIDENGMPVKVDKSMEANNLEAPLQRNLFGDELGPALGQDRGLTAAIDATPANGMWAQRRGQINRLGGRGQDLPAGNDLLAAMQEANGPKLPFDPTAAFDPRNPLPTERLGANALPPPRLGGPDAPAAPGGAPVVPTPDGGSITTLPKVDITIHQKDGSFIATKNGEPVGRMEVNMTPDQMRQQLTLPGDIIPATVDIVKVAPEHQGTGVGRKLYEAMNEAYQGHIAPSGITTPAAWNVWKKVFPEKVQDFVTDQAKLIQRGADADRVVRSITDPEVAQRVHDQATIKETAPSDTALNSEVLPPQERPAPVDTVQHPISPAKIAERQQTRQAAEQMPIKDPRLDEFLSVNTIEEGMQLAKDGGYKDTAPTWVGRNLGSGANFHAIMTNNPVIKYINTAFKNARVAQEQFSQKFVSNKDAGLTPMWEKMNDAQKSDAIAALMEGDSRQAKMTPAELDQLGFSEAQKNYIDSYYNGDKALYDRNAQVKAGLGLKDPPYREGHFPGIFKGGYKALVTHADGVTAVLSTDSRGQMKAAQEWIKENHPGATMTEVKRKGLASYKNESDLLSGQNDILALLAEHDPRWAEVQAINQEAIKHGNNSIFAFNRHELSKKGVIGNEGNKPWLDPKENAQSAHEALVQYFEEGALHHELQQPLFDVKKFIANQDIPMPKTKEFANSYIEHITGKDANNPVAQALNFAIDQPGRALGYGPVSTLRVAGAIKNRMSQVFMGFLNYPFLAAQMLQPIQTVAPVMAILGGRLGNTAKIPLMMTKGASTWAHGFAELTTGKDLGVNPVDRQIVQYGVDRGIAGFSEMEKAYEGRNSKLMRGFNQVAEVNMKLGETTTRMPSFIATTHLLVDGGVPLERAMQVAEKATQFSMFDYHKWERAPIYGKLGVMGNFAGALTTFKHAYIGNQIKLLQEAKGGPESVGLAHGNALPIVSSLLSMLALAGVSGMPGYDDLDKLYGVITDKFFGKQKNIRDSVMSELPEGMKSGYLGVATNLAMNSKFSSASVLPDYEHPAAVVSPQLSAFMQVIADGIDVVKNGDKQSFANLLLDAAPSGMKGFVEEGMFKDKDGNLLDRNQQVKYHRSPEEWQMRKWSGLRSQKEMLNNEEVFRAGNAMQADTAAKKDMENDFKRAAINNNIGPNVDKIGKFADRGGDPKAIINAATTAAVMSKMTPQEREAYLLKQPNLAGVRKMEYFTQSRKPGDR